MRILSLAWVQVLVMAMSIAASAPHPPPDRDDGDRGPACEGLLSRISSPGLLGSARWDPGDPGVDQSPFPQPSVGGFQHCNFDCDDLNPCTKDSCTCDPRLGCGCEHELLSGRNCDDRDACTASDTCINGTCVGTPIPFCDDGDLCTLDACDRFGEQCTHTRAEILYGTDGSSGNLYHIDQATGDASFVGGMGFRAPALAADPTTGILYAGEGGGSPNLYRVDPITGASSLVGSTGFGRAAIGGMDFDSSGRLYAAANIIDDGGTGGDTLVVIDKLTAVGTAIGLFGSGIGLAGGSGGIEGIVFDRAGTLWGVSGSQVGTSGGTALWTIDTSTGRASLVALIQDARGDPPDGGVVSLEIDSAGVMYGGTGRYTGNLIQIDPATGLFVLTGRSVLGSLGGLAFLVCGCFVEADCNDANACTADSCDLLSGACSHAPLPGTDCDDGDICSLDHCDPNTGGCLHDRISCDDGNACTLDTCDPAAGGCVHVGHPGEAGPLFSQDSVTFVWNPAPTAAIHNTYRGTITGIGTLGTRSPTYDHVCFESDDEQLNGPTLSVDAAMPPEGSVFYYLVNGESFPDCQGTLGTASDGTLRTPLQVCPTPP